MKFHRRSKLVPGAFALLIVVATTAAPLAGGLARSAQADTVAPAHYRLNCAKGLALCTEVYDSEHVFGEGVYVGHDEPSTLFYSNQPGSGNRMLYFLRLPTDPPAAPPSGTHNYQLHPAFWFGMAMCDTQSYPEQVSTCTPDSDTNIVDPAVSPNHPGTAFMELQFYPPGWVNWPPGISCDATKWCAALNIDSLSQDPVHQTQLNNTCLNQLGGNPEYVNFAFLTKNGIAQAPANPIQSTTTTFTPDPTKDLFMNSGDSLLVLLQDTSHGLLTWIDDLTTHQTGFMISSAANSFGQVQFAPPPSTACTNIPYDFHPMYSTSSELTRVPWAAHSYNIAFADEIGHFDYCSAVNATTGTCSGTEGSPGDVEANDTDDFGCFDTVPPAGCTGTNTGFDGVPYQKVWPDGDTAHHPFTILFSSPLTGSSFNVRYSRMAFEADLPRIERDSFQQCNKVTGANCTLIPLSDEGTAVPFYPFFTAARIGNLCLWTLGNDIPSLTTNDFGKNSQYGSLLKLTYTNGSSTQQIYEDYRQIFQVNPCTLDGLSHPAVIAP